MLLDGDTLWLVGALLAAGFVSGLLAGLFGVGGGGVMVPVLYELFHVIGAPDEARMRLAIGTSLAIIVPTTFRSFRAHRMRGAVDIGVIWKLGPAVAAGSVIGVVIASLAHSSLLKLVYVVTAPVMAAKLIAGGENWRLGDALPGNPASSLVGLVIGVICTLTGFGGGVFISSYMTIYGRPIHQAVATSSGFGQIIAIPAVAGYVWAGWDAAGLPPGSLGYVSLLGAAIVAPASVLAAPLGVRIAHGISRRKLELAFAIFLMALGMRFTLSLA